MQLVSIIIPIAPHHIDIAKNAIASAHAQTIPCEVITVTDYELRGSGWSRNAGARQASGLFLIFLDADDTLHPEFAERTLAAWQYARYTYTDDLQGDFLHATADCLPYSNGNWHVNTTLLPAKAFWHVGGYNEDLPAIEDLDLYLRLQEAGVCGVRCPMPLLNYTPYGQRSKVFMDLPNRDTLKIDIYQRYAKMADSNCGCGQRPQSVHNPPEDLKQDGDILVEAQGLAREIQTHSRATPGRMYPRARGLFGYRIWVNPIDAAANPVLYKPIVEFDPTKVSPDVELVRLLAQKAMEAR